MERLQWESQNSGIQSADEIRREYYTERMSYQMTVYIVNDEVPISTTKALAVGFIDCLKTQFTCLVQMLTSSQLFGQWRTVNVPPVSHLVIPSAVSASTEMRI